MKGKWYPQLGLLGCSARVLEEQACWSHSTPPQGAGPSFSLTVYHAQVPLRKTPFIRTSKQLCAVSSGASPVQGVSLQLLFLSSLLTSKKDRTHLESSKQLLMWFLWLFLHRAPWWRVWGSEVRYWLFYRYLSIVQLLISYNDINRYRYTRSWN